MVGFFCAVAGNRLGKLWRNECADGAVEHLRRQSDQDYHQQQTNLGSRLRRDPSSSFRGSLSGSFWGKKAGVTP
jgi:hypothetical protein